MHFCCLILALSPTSLRRDWTIFCSNWAIFRSLEEYIRESLSFWRDLKTFWSLCGRVGLCSPGSLVFWLTLIRLVPKKPSILFALAPLGLATLLPPPLPLPHPSFSATSLSLTWTGCQSSQTAGQRVAKSAQLPGKLGGQAEGRKHRLSLKVGRQWISGSWTSKGGPLGFPSCLGRSFHSTVLPVLA